MKEFESFAFRMLTDEGDLIAFGGICEKGTREHWIKKLQKIGELPFRRTDMISLDMTLAIAIEKLAEPSLFLAGASIKAPIELEPGQRTGGVIGQPTVDDESEDGEIVQLENGFLMVSRGGGPGAAMMTEDPANLELITEEFGEHPVLDEQLIARLQRNGVQAGLIVTDGTGENAHGCIAAFSGTRAEQVHF